MKTAISLPNDLFAVADELAKKLGVSRSELFVTALREFIFRREHDDLTDKINAACEKLDTRLPRDIASTARHRLLETEW